MVDESIWLKLLEKVKAVSISVSSLLTSAKPLKMEDDKLHLGVYYKFHKEMLEDVRSRKILETIANEVFNKNIRFEYSLLETPSVNVPNPVLTEVKNDNILKSAEELFG